MSVRLGAGLSLQPVCRDGQPDQRNHVDRSAERSRPGDRAGFRRGVHRRARRSSTSPRVRFDNQAKFHPRKYLIALLRLLCAGKGCQVYEQTNIDEIEGTPITATTSRRRVAFIASMCSSRRTCRCRASRDCCPRPCCSRSSRRTARTSIGGWVPRGTVHEALFWDTGDPYDYLRVDRRHDHDFVIFGGEDHKTGQVEDTTQCFRRLEQRLKLLLPEIAMTHRWSGQVIETNDGLPYIGETAERQYAATGFCGQRHDVRHSLSHDVRRLRRGRDRIRGPSCSIRGARRSRAGSGTTSRKTRTTRITWSAIDSPARAGVRCAQSSAAHGEVIDVNGQPAAVYRGLDSQIHVRVSGLHAHGLLRALQRCGAHVGLPLSWVALQGEW